MCSTEYGSAASPLHNPERPTSVQFWAPPVFRECIPTLIRSALPNIREFVPMPEIAIAAPGISNAEWCADATSKRLEASYAEINRAVVQLLESTSRVSQWQKTSLPEVGLLTAWTSMERATRNQDGTPALIRPVLYHVDSKKILIEPSILASALVSSMALRKNPEAVLPEHEKTARKLNFGFASAYMQWAIDRELPRDGSGGGLIPEAIDTVKKLHGALLLLAIEQKPTEHAPAALADTYAKLKAVIHEAGWAKTLDRISETVRMAYVNRKPISWVTIEVGTSGLF